MFRTLCADIACIRRRDPAARHLGEVLTCYPGLHALVLHRVAHGLWRLHLRWLARFLAYWTRAWTGVDIHPAARIGQGVFFDHAMGIVIGETAEIGDGCTIYQGVTLGGTSLYKGVKRHPTLKANVVVGAGAKILGGFEVGEGAKIGSNAVVTKPVEPGVTVVGVPASPVGPDHPEMTDHQPTPLFSAYGVTPTDDPVGNALHQLAKTCEQQQKQIAQLQTELDTLKQVQQVK
jgi:serine O-acetyltransferase